jgi:triacylglycerol lipase
MSRALLAALSLAALAVTACGGSAPEETTSASDQDLTSACASIAGKSCSKVPAGDWRSPTFWGDLSLDMWANERHAAMQNIEPGPTPLATPRTVLLVTGVTIKAEWFDPIAARLKRDGFIPVVYEPPALLSYDLFQAAEDLKVVVERTRAASGQEKIDILAECTGGLIARHYIQSLGGDSAVSRLVTFVSPQHGIAKAPMAAAIAGWPALHDLSPGSAFLHAVNDAPMNPNVPMTSIYTCTDEFIRPYQTSIVPGATNIGLCGHGFVGHFQTLYDPSIYLIMHDALLK